MRPVIKGAGHRHINSSWGDVLGSVLNTGLNAITGTDKAQQEIIQAQIAAKTKADAANKELIKYGLLILAIIAVIYFIFKTK